MRSHGSLYHDYEGLHQAALFGLSALPNELPTWPAISKHGRSSQGGGILSGLTCVSVPGTLPTSMQTVPGLMFLNTDRVSMRLQECWEIVYLSSPGFKWSWNWVFSRFLSLACMNFEQWLLACSISRESFQRLQHCKCKNACMQKRHAHKTTLAFFFYAFIHARIHMESAGGGPSTNNFHAHLAKEKVYSQVHRVLIACERVFMIEALNIFPHICNKS